MPPTPLQSWLIAFSIYPIGDHSVVYVTIGCCLTTLGGFQLFLVLWCVCVSITCSYHMQLSDPLAGSPKNPEMVGTPACLVLAPGG